VDRGTLPQSGESSVKNGVELGSSETSEDKTGNHDLGEGLKMIKAEKAKEYEQGVEKKRKGDVL